jgi:hypothetical protein
MIPDAALQPVKVMIVLVLASSLMATVILVYKALGRPLMLWWINIGG